MYNFQMASFVDTPTVCPVACQMVMMTDTVWSLKSWAVGVVGFIEMLIRDTGWANSFLCSVHPCLRSSEWNPASLSWYRSHHLVDLPKISRLHVVSLYHLGPSASGHRLYGDTEVYSHHCPYPWADTRGCQKQRQLPFRCNRPEVERLELRRLNNWTTSWHVW